MKHPSVIERTIKEYTFKVAFILHTPSQQSICRVSEQDDYDADRWNDIEYSRKNTNNVLSGLSSNRFASALSGVAPLIAVLIVLC